MAVFNHKSPVDRQYLTHFRADHGDGRVVLAWETRDGLPRELMVFRSREAFAQEGIDPRSDARQTLIYRGTDRHSKVQDAALEDGVHYFYSVFVLGNDSVWHLQLTTVATPGGHASWQWPWQHEFDSEHYELVRCDICDGTGLRVGELKLGQGFTTLALHGSCWKCHGKGWLEVKKASD